MRITSSGILRNEDKPRIGVTCLNRCPDWIFDEIDGGTDIVFEDWYDDLLTQNLSEKEIEYECDMYDNDYRIVYFGDAWVKTCDGSYIIDKTKEYAASYNNDTNIVTVHWSKYTKKCHHTSPCYVMANGDGPCADLDTDGDSVIGFCLPNVEG